MVEQTPEPDYARKTIAVMDALERWDQDPAAEQDVSEAISAVFPGGGMFVLLGWAQLLSAVADDGEEALFAFADGAPAFRRDLAAEFVAVTEQDRHVQLDMLNRILDLDDEHLWSFAVHLAHAVRRHVFAPCGGARHCLMVLAGCEEAAQITGRTEFVPAVMPCGVALAASSAGDYETARRSSGIGVARAGFSPMVTLLWFVAKGTSRGAARAYLVDEHGVPDQVIGTDPGDDPQQRVHALALRLLRTSPQEAVASTVFAEIRALDWEDKMGLVWDLVTGVGSLFTRALAQQKQQGAG